MDFLKKNIPESYILFSMLFYWASTALIINPIAIILLLVFSFQLWKQHKKLGIGLGIFYLALNLYMCLALFSELSDFNTVTSDPIILFFVGSLFLGLNILAAGFMIRKYASIRVLTVT